MPEAATIEGFCIDKLGVRPLAVTSLPPLRHAFTHFELEIAPLRVQADGAAGIMDGTLQWHGPDALPGVPAPVQRIIDQQQGAAEP